MAVPITIRVPKGLAAVLRACAEHEGLSVNQYVVYVLSRATSSPAFADQDVAWRALLDATASPGRVASGDGDPQAPTARGAKRVRGAAPRPTKNPQVATKPRTRRR